MPAPSTLRSGAPERLSRMVQLPTVSAELDRRGLADFDRFRELLAEVYPLVHERLAFEQVTEPSWMRPSKGGKLQPSASTAGTTS